MRGTRAKPKPKIARAQSWPDFWTCPDCKLDGVSLWPYVSQCLYVDRTPMKYGPGTKEVLWLCLKCWFERMYTYSYTMEVKP